MRNSIYKVGDVVYIKSLKWYNENTNGIHVDVRYGFMFAMTEYCGKRAKIVITNVDGYSDKYRIDIDGGKWCF